MGRMQLRIDELIKARELQERHRLALDDVARATGIAADTLVALAANRVETVSLSDLARLCGYFHCTAGELLYYDAGQDTLGADEVDSRDIVARWERTFGADERVPDA